MTRLFRAFAFLALGLLLGGTATYSFAGYAQLKPPANIGGSVGSRVTAGSISANSGQFSAGFTTQVAGKTVTMPATMRFASNAAQVAIGAIRLSPTALMGTAVAAWLLPYGLEWVEGQWQKRLTPTAPLSDYWIPSGEPSMKYATKNEACLAFASFYGFTDASATTNDNICNYMRPGLPWPYGHPMENVVGSPCLTGFHLTGGACVPDAETAPATEPDFAEPAGEPLPDEVAEELAPKAVPIPLEEPAFNPQPVNIPLSEPYPKPNGQPGETVKDVVKVTPAPGEKVKIETEVVPVTGPNGVPIPTTNPDGSANPEAAPEEKPDFCIENPDALACWKDGEPEDVDLAKDTKNVAITPQGGWGPDTATCPQPRKHVLKNGYTVQMSWEPVCDGAGMFRPVVLGLAWLAAIYAFMAMYRKSQA